MCALHERHDHVGVDISVERIEIFFEILVTVLKNEGQFSIRMEDIVKPNYVFMLKFFKEAYFPKC